MDDQAGCTARAFSYSMVRIGAVQKCLLCQTEKAGVSILPNDTELRDNDLKDIVKVRRTKKRKINCTFEKHR